MAVAREGFQELKRLVSSALPFNSPVAAELSSLSCASLPSWLALARPEAEAACQARCQTAYLGEKTALCRVLGKYLMYVDSTDLSLAPHLLLNGFWEMWITEAVVRALRPGWNCVDVGANL